MKLLHNTHFDASYHSRAHASLNANQECGAGTKLQETIKKNCWKITTCTSGIRTDVDPVGAPTAYGLDASTYSNMEHDPPSSLQAQVDTAQKSLKHTARPRLANGEQKIRAPPSLPRYIV